VRATAQQPTVVREIQEEQDEAPAGEDAAEAAPPAAEQHAPRRGWLFGRRHKLLEERLMEELAEERMASNQIRAQLVVHGAENSANIGEMNSKIERTREGNAALEARLDASRERKQALEEEAASLARQHSKEEGLKWAPLIKEQSAAIRKVVGVVEQLESEETALEADIAQCQRSNERMDRRLDSALAATQKYFKAAREGKTPGES